MMSPCRRQRRRRRARTLLRGERRLWQEGTQCELDLPRTVRGTDASKQRPEGRQDAPCSKLQTAPALMTAIAAMRMDAEAAGLQKSKHHRLKASQTPLEISH